MAHRLTSAITIGCSPIAASGQGWIRVFVLLSSLRLVHVGFLSGRVERLSGVCGLARGTRALNVLVVRRVGLGILLVIVVVDVALAVAS